MHDEYIFILDVNYLLKLKLLCLCNIIHLHCELLQMWMPMDLYERVFSWRVNILSVLCITLNCEFSPRLLGIAELIFLFQSSSISV